MSRRPGKPAKFSARSTKSIEYATWRHDAPLLIQPRRPEREVFSRQCGEIEVDAQHVVQAVQQQRIRQRDAQPRAGGRKIGAGDLYLPWRFHRPAEERLGLP